MNIKDGLRLLVKLEKLVDKGKAERHPIVKDTLFYKVKRESFGFLELMIEPDFRLNSSNDFEVKASIRSPEYAEIIDIKYFVKEINRMLR